MDCLDPIDDDDQRSFVDEVGSFATEDDMLERRICRLPKRLRTARYQAASTINATYAGFNDGLRNGIATMDTGSAHSHSGSDEGVPHLYGSTLNDGASLSSATSLSAGECLTPPAYSAYYQPVFASVASLVKQVAATTTLFGNISLSDDTDKQEETRPEDFPREADISPSLSTKRLPPLDPSEQLDDDLDLPIMQNNRKKRKVPAPMGLNHFPSSPPNFSRTLTDHGEEVGYDDADSLSPDGIPARTEIGSTKQAHVSNGRGSSVTPTKKPRTPYSGYNRSPQSLAKSKSKRSALSPLSPNKPVLQQRVDRSPSPSRKAVRAKQAKTSQPTLPELPVPPPNIPPTSSNTDSPKSPIVLPNLWDPALGWLVPTKSKPSKATVNPFVAEGQSHLRAVSTDRGPALPNTPFQFHVPLSQMLARRLEELQREKERLQLARDLARERLRDLEQVKRQAEAELAAAKRKSSGIHYVNDSCQTGGDASEGKEIYASRWSTVEPSQPLTRPPKQQAKNAAGIDSKGNPSAKKGKKKRSAHANANNVHHRDNYVPTRQNKNVPAPGLDAFPSLGLVGADNDFSTENYHPQLGYTNLIPFFAGSDEWICSWCEIGMFFGDDATFKRLIRKRKSLVKIRKRAQRRAARAASGQAPNPAKTKKNKPAAQTTAQPSTRKNSAVQTVDQTKYDPHAPPPAAPAPVPASATSQNSATPSSGKPSSQSTSATRAIRAT